MSSWIVSQLIRVQVLNDDAVGIPMTSHSRRSDIQSCTMLSTQVAIIAPRDETGSDSIRCEVASDPVSKVCSLDHEIFVPGILFTSLSLHIVSYLHNWLARCPPPCKLPEEI